MTAARAETPGTSAPDRRDLWVALGLTLAGLAASVVLGQLSDGLYHRDDWYHYLYARDSWDRPDIGLHWWARPGYNYVTMPVARFAGLAGCRVLSAVLTAVTAVLAYRVALQVGLPRRWACWVPGLVWLQPLVMTLSMTTLTETPAALYLTLSVWLYLRGNPVAACAVLSVLFVTRIETAALAVIPAAGILHTAWVRGGRKLWGALRQPLPWICAGALLWAPVAYCIAAQVAGVPPRHNPIHIFSIHHPKDYGAGAWYSYLLRWAQASTFALTAAAVAGAVHLGRRGAFVTAWALGLVALHGVLFRFELFSSGGYGRFLVPAGGLYAVLAAGGLAGIWRRASRRLPASALLTAAVCAGAAWIACRWVLQGYEAAAIAACLAVVAPLAVATLARPQRVQRFARRAAVAALVLTAAVQYGIQVRPLDTPPDPGTDLSAVRVRPGNGTRTS